MKRKEARVAIARMSGMTLAIDGSVSLMNAGTGEGYDLDMRQTLAVVRGTLAWCWLLLDPKKRGAGSDAENMQELLMRVGEAVALELDADGGERPRAEAAE